MTPPNFEPRSPLDPHVLVDALLEAEASDVAHGCATGALSRAAYRQADHEADRIAKLTTRGVGMVNSSSTRPPTLERD
jgi:hypothetical protein